MSRESTLVLLATLVAITPFSGLPLAWLTWLLPILGISLAAISISLRARRRRAEASLYEHSPVSPA